MAIVYERAVKEDLDLGEGTVTRTNPAGGQMTGHQINLASFALTASETYDSTVVAPGIPVAHDVTVPGARKHHPVTVSFDGAGDQTLEWTGYVITDDTVRVVVRNDGVISVNPGSGTLRVLVFRIP